MAAILAAALPASVLGGILDGCLSTVTPVGFPAHIAVCPAGDGQTLADVGARVDIIARAPDGWAVQYIYPEDFWLMDCSGANYDNTCFSAGFAYADQITDANGYTFITGTLAVGGMGSGASVFLQGVIALAPPECAQILCLPLGYRSADINGDLVVNMVDLAMFAGSFPPNAYDPAADFDFNGSIGLGDLAFFAAHFMHGCP